MISPHARSAPHPTLFNGNAQTTLAELSNVAAAAAAMSRPGIPVNPAAMVFQLRQAMLQNQLQAPPPGALPPHPNVLALQTQLQLPLAQPAGVVNAHGNHVDRPGTSGGGPDRRVGIDQEI